jgi:hypothetical protein
MNLENLHMEIPRKETFQQKLISLMERKLFKLHVDTIIVWHRKVIQYQLNFKRMEMFINGEIMKKDSLETTLKLMNRNQF